MKKILFFSAVLLIISISSCSKSDKEIVEESWKLSQNASVNLEIKKLKKKLKTAENDFVRAEIYSKIATIQVEKGNLRKSIKSSLEAIKFQPNQYLSHYLLGKSYLQSGRYDDSEEHLQQSIELNRKFAPSHFELGNLFYKRYKYKKAIKEYKKAVKLDKIHFQAYNNLGVLYNLIGKKRKAEKLFKKVVKIKPDFSSAYKNLGILYDIKLKKKALAIRNYKIYLKMNPNCPDRRVVKMWIRVLGG